MQNIAIFGATGSIGGSTLDVLSHYQDRYRVFALTANSRIDVLVQLCEKHRPVIALVADEKKKPALAHALSERGLNDIEVWGGEADLVKLAALPQVDVAVLAIVGAAGLAPTFSAARAGKRLLLANKESVVCGGALLMNTIKEHGAELLPVDSEHNAIFQCLASSSEHDRNEARIILTASGDRLAMSGLEVIEASWLFGFPPDRIDVVIHPQSLIHSMVQYADGCILAQMGAPDMRTPIAYSLGWPERLDGFAKRVDFAALGTVTFEAPDMNRFPQLAYAYEALREGGAASIVLNAANEIAVEAFLERRIAFLDIARACRTMMDSLQLPAPSSLEEVLHDDRLAREKTREVIARW